MSKSRKKVKQRIQRPIPPPYHEPPPPPPLHVIPDPEVRKKVESWWDSVKNMFGWT